MNLLPQRVWSGTVKPKARKEINRTFLKVMQMKGAKCYRSLCDLFWFPHTFLEMMGCISLSTMARGIEAVFNDLGGLGWLG